MERITGVYYDGKSSKPIPVTVHLGTIELRLTNEMGALGETEVLWTLSKLEDVDFSSANTIQLKYGKLPSESLIIRDPEAVAKFKTFFPETDSNSLYKRLLKGNALRIFGISLVVLVAVVSLYMTVVAPFIAEKAVYLVSPSAEVVLGDKMSETLFATLDIDDEKSELLKAFYDASDFESTYPIRLHVVDDPTVNAFAVPGGKIVVFQGIIDKMESWEELAGLLGHELAHVEKRHSLKAMSRSLSTYLIISIMTGDVNGIGAVFLENSMMLRDLSNSRLAESEADQTGLAYLIEQEISPQGMVDLFQHLKEAEGEITEKGGKLLEILSTHPLTSDRISSLESAIEKYETVDFPEKAEVIDLFEQLQNSSSEEMEETKDNEEETNNADEDTD